MTQTDSVKNFYLNVLHNADPATRRHKRDSTENDYFLIAAAKQARAHAAEAGEEAEEESEEKEDLLKPYEAENLLRAAQQARQEALSGAKDPQAVAARTALYGVPLGEIAAAFGGTERARTALTPEQAEDFKERYDVADLGPDERAQLLDALRACGAVTDREWTSAQRVEFPTPGIVVTETDPDLQRRKAPENRDLIDWLRALNEDQSRLHASWQKQQRRAPDVGVLADGKERESLIAVLEQLRR